MYCLSEGCEQVIYVDTYPLTWSGLWTDFTGTFSGGTNCGDGGGGEDIWFVVRIPAGLSVGVAETTSSNVTLREVDSCNANSCVQSAENPEVLQILGTSSSDSYAYLVVSEAAANTVNALSLSFTEI